MTHNSFISVVEFVQKVMERVRLRDVTGFSRQIVYVVLWCAVYSSLHLYLTESVMKLWVLCLCVSLIVFVITLAIILVFHYSHKEAGKRFLSNSCSNLEKSKSLPATLTSLIGVLYIYK